MNGGAVGDELEAEQDNPTGGVTYLCGGQQAQSPSGCVLVFHLLGYTLRVRETCPLANTSLGHSAWRRKSRTRRHRC